MKTILINPPSRERYGKQKRVSGIVPPLGLAYLASSLIKAGFDVEIIDSYAFDYSVIDIENILKKKDFEIIGITATTLSLDIAIEILRISKIINPNCVTIIGGPHTTALPTETLKSYSFIDFIIRGEAEETIVELLDKIEKRESYYDIKGISYKEGDKIRNNPDRELIQDLDSLPFPAYDLLPMDKYFPSPHHGFSFYKKVNNYPFFSIFTSRGCPYRCTFCASAVTWRRKVRVRSTDNVMEEIDLLVDKYKIKNLDIYDDTFLLKKDRTIQILNELIKRNYDLDFSCLSRVDSIDDEIVSKLSKANCYSLRFGIESGSPKILELMKKDINLNQALDAFKLIKKYNIVRNACFIFGHPGETLDTANETIKFVKKLDPDVAFFYILVPFHGTEVMEIVKTKNLLVNTKSENWTFVAKETNIRTESLSSEDLIKLRKKAYRAFYLRPKYISDKLIKIKSLDTLKFYIDGVRSIFSN